MKIKQYIKIYILTVCLATLGICKTSFANSKNLAYEDDFSWHLAGRLTTQFFELKTSKNLDANEGEIAILKQQIEIIYHHLLVECNGPLPTLAPIFKFFELSNQKDERYASTLAAEGRMDSEIWPVITKWEISIRFKALEMLKSGSYGFFPKCVTPGFREQNTIP